MQLTSKAGDVLVLGSDSQGLHLLLNPQNPPDEEYHDLITLGLNFSSIARLVACLKDGGTISLGRRTTFSATEDGSSFSFEKNDRSGSSFASELDLDSTNKLLKYLSALLDGSRDSDYPGGTSGVEKKVPRNAPCPCGSGRKYKKCCLNKGSQSASTRGQLSFLEGSQDPEVVSFLSYVTENPMALEDPRTWNELGVAIGSNNDHLRALKAFTLGERLSPDDPEIKLNLAVTHGALGDYTRALKVAKAVPDGFRRKPIVLANILQELGRHEEAISHYEKAISEEPNFFLPYARMFNSLRATENPLLEYWLKAAVQAVPNEPEIARAYCYHLLRQNRLQELSEAEWIDHLESSQGRTDMVGRSENDPLLIVEAQIFRSIGQVIQSGSPDELSNAASILKAADPRWHLCDVAKLLVAQAAAHGEPQIVSESYGRICKTCLKEKIGIHGPEATYLARAHLVSGDLQGAVKHAEDALSLDGTNENTLWDLWWCLDELGRIDESIEIAQRLYKHNPSVSDGCMPYNLGYLCGKRGSLGLARHYYETAIEADGENWRATENLSFILLLEGELENANKLWQKYKSLTEGVRITLSENQLLDEEDEEIEDPWEATPNSLVVQKQAKWETLLAAAEETKNSPSYALDLLRLNESSDPIIGSHATIRSMDFSIDKILEALASTEVEGSIEIRHQLQMQKRGDHSALIVGLRQELEAWDALPNEAKMALLEGERRLGDGASVDHAPTVVTLAKAVEIVLRRVVFDAFSVQCQTDIDLDKHLSDALQDKDQKAQNFIRFVQRGQHLELGSMTFALKLCKGKTGRRLVLLGRFLRFVREDLGRAQLLEADSLSDLDELSGHRNPAAHSDVYDHLTARRVRTLALRQLARILACG